MLLTSTDLITFRFLTLLSFTLQYRAVAAARTPEVAHAQNKCPRPCVVWPYRGGVKGSLGGQQGAGWSEGRRIVGKRRWKRRRKESARYFEGR